MQSQSMPALTRNQSMVFDTLTSAGEPMSAYNILDQLRSEGLRAPLQVYRALDKLVAIGKVHRLESLNAFVACRHPECESHQITAFTICETCGCVAELADNDLAKQLQKLANETHFDLKRSIVELRGLCIACQQAA